LLDDTPLILGKASSSGTCRTICSCASTNRPWVDATPWLHVAALGEQDVDLAMRRTRWHRIDKTGAPVIDSTHDDRILDQFTRQAQVFNTAGAITNAQALAMIVGAGTVGPDDTVLDVACGGGLVACAFAPFVAHATGIDVTPAMLERAAHHAAELGLRNVTWRQGNVARLPFPDASFSVVVTRFSLHHFEDPLAAVREMVRVCRAGGRLVIVDMYASEDPAKAREWNRLEKLRDPSHVRCLTLTELRAAFPELGLPEPAVAFYDLRDTVTALLARSFPNPGDDRLIRSMFADAIGDDRLGLEITRDGSEIRYAYPVAILSTSKPGAAATGS